MKINWKSFKIQFGRVHIRLKTVIATVLISAIGSLQSLEYIDLNPIVSFFVKDENRAAFYVTTITILMAVLRGVTTGPLWEMESAATMHPDDPDTDRS